MVATDLAHVAWAAQMGCLGFHPWPYRADDPANTDELRIELTNLPLIASFTVPSTQTTSYVFHSPLPLQRFSIDLLRRPRGLSGVVTRPFAPNNSP